ncbi:MAG: hypothetical protein E7112_00935 [Bacteroidales bacterium]|nr:hypothetical protein [Bacteroidales bacterium]
MTLEQFNEAIQIISVQHSSTVKINSPRGNFVGDLGVTNFRLHVIKSVPAVIKDLAAAGFSLSMTEDGLFVDKY